MQRGVSPEGRHFYPAFPYASYTRMQPHDVAELRAFLATLPAVAGRAPARAGVSVQHPPRPGLWKLAFLTVAPGCSSTADSAVARGQYLVEGPGHCGECHTPRNSPGAMDIARWLGGAPEPEGEGRVPNITGGAGGIGDWSVADIVYFFESGFLPDFDSVGGAMVEVQENLAMLAGEDRAAIAAYLKAVPPQDSARP